MHNYPEKNKTNQSSIVIRYKKFYPRPLIYCKTKFSFSQINRKRKKNHVPILLNRFIDFVSVDISMVILFSNDRKDINSTYIYILIM